MAANVKLGVNDWFQDRDDIEASFSGRVIARDMELPMAATTRVSRGRRGDPEAATCAGVVRKR